MISELRRRRLIQTAALYIAVAWGGTEILVFLVDALFGESTADAARRYLAISLIAGFPAAMYLAWTRDLGLKARRLVSASVVAVLIVAVLVVLIPEPPPPDGRVPITENSIAILPFEVCDDRVSDRMLARGLTGAVFNRLAQRDHLKIMGRRSVETVLESAPSLATAAGLLGVEYLLSGIVCRDGLDLTLRAELTDRKGFIVWERDFKQVVSRSDQVEQRLASLVDNGVATELGDAIPARSDEAVDRRALEQLLIGQGHSEEGNNERTIDNVADGLKQVRPIVDKALVFARTELQRDPNSFNANQVAGRILHSLGVLEDSLAYRAFASIGEEGVAAARSKALVYYTDAEQHFRTALAVNSSASDVRRRLTHSMDEQGVQRREESLQILLDGLNLDPFNEELSSRVAYRLDEFGRLREAMERLDRFGALPQGKSQSQYWPQLEILQNQGRIDEKLAYLIEILENDSSEMVLTHLWWTAAEIARLGLVEEAEALYATVERIPDPDAEEDGGRSRQRFLVDFYLWATGGAGEMIDRNLKKTAGLSNEDILKARHVEAVDYAWTFWMAGKQVRAIELLEALQHLPYEPTRWAQRQMMLPMQLVTMYMQVGREEDAAPVLQNAMMHLQADVDAGARHHKTLMLLASAYGWLGDDEAALGTLDLAVDYGAYLIPLCCDEYWPYEREDFHIVREWWDGLEGNPEFIQHRSRMQALVEQQRSNIRSLLAQNDMEQLLAPLMVGPHAAARSE
jgi:TolB-like protein